MFRTLIDQIIVTPLGKRLGVSLEIRGNLAALLSDNGEPRVRSRLVTGEGFDSMSRRVGPRPPCGSLIRFKSPDPKTKTARRKAGPGFGCGGRI